MQVNPIVLMAGAMNDSGIRLQIILKLDEKWASHQTREELIEYIRSRLDTSLGFRGKIEKLKVIEKRPGVSPRGIA